MAMLIETNGSRKSIYMPEDKFSMEDIEFYIGGLTTMIHHEDGSVICFNQSSTLDINRDVTDSVKFAYPKVNLTIRGRVFLCNINQLN